MTLMRANSLALRLFLELLSLLFDLEHLLDMLLVHRFSPHHI